MKKKTVKLDEKWKAALNRLAKDNQDGLLKFALYGLWVTVGKAVLEQLEKASLLQKKQFDDMMKGCKPSCKKPSAEWVSDNIEMKKKLGMK